ncbi:MAG TPA: alcohol dehydrogenase catalytic domain-containing protein [Acidimicrobiales bacterium]|nr:alcohol dehydrogenase catalytic domain-containing protein [Acidimicrobiales bacterium]
MQEIAGSMLAAVYKGEHTIAVEEVPVPEVGPDQVLLEISHCGVCGSDVHTLWEDWGTPGSVAGHEYSGVVVKVGKNVDGWRVGDRAVGGPRRGCGRCARCEEGRTNLCAGRPKVGLDPYFGAFAAYKTVDATCLYRVPDDLDLRTAALTEPMAVALHGIRKVQLSPGFRVLVTGAGPIGLLHVALLRAMGIEDVTVSEPSPVRQEAARRVGATTILEPDQLEVPTWPMELVAQPYQAAFDCSGNRAAMENALANLDVGGTLVLSGTGMRRPKFDPNRIILNELTITGTVEYTPDDYERSLDMLASGQLHTDLLIEPEDQPLSRLEWTLGCLSRGDLAGKVMVVPRA